MTAGSTTLHEDDLPPDVVDRHRAIVSMMEELEAVDWYDQRVAAATDPSLAAVLAHNRDEEKEHFAMTLEWLRRNDPKLDEHLRTYLFTDPTDLIEVEHQAEGGDAGAGTAEGGGGATSLRVGDLRNESEGSL